MWQCGLLVFLIAQIQIEGKIESDEDTGESDDLGAGYNTSTKNYTQPKDLEEQIDENGERIGATVALVARHPYAAALLKNDTYECSAIILNSYWVAGKTDLEGYSRIFRCLLETRKQNASDVLTEYQLHNDSDPYNALQFSDKIIGPIVPLNRRNVIMSYVNHRYLGNYTIRIGSSYNNKGGTISKIKMLINNFDQKVSVAKLQTAFKFTSQIKPVLLPKSDEEVSLGNLASMIAWTPTGHMRVVNAPIIDSSICEPTAKRLSGRYIICIGGVQDPNRHFCRKDNGGAVIQNNTLVAITSFLHTCALYTKTHAFPKVASFSRWLDSVIWDEDNRPATSIATSASTRTTHSTPLNTTESTYQNMFVDPRKFMLTLPFDPIKVPLEPAEDNSVIPRMSLYESFLQNLAKAKTSTTVDPNAEVEKKEWLVKLGKSVLSSQVLRKKYDTYDYK